MTEIQSQRQEMSRVDAVRIEMASAVRLLGESAATTKEATWIAARQALETRFRTTDPDFHCFDVAAPVELDRRAGAASSLGTDGADQ